METIAETHRTRTADLYREYQGFVLNVCKGILKDAEEAQEATQEAFIKVMRSLAGFEGLCQPKTWIYRIAVNECFTRLAARKRAYANLERLALHSRIESDLVREPGAHFLLARKALQRGLDKVGESTRKVVRMYVDQGLCQRDIAVNLGVSRVAVTRRITRFRNAMAADRTAYWAKEWLRQVA